MIRPKEFSNVFHTLFSESDEEGHLFIFHFIYFEFYEMITEMMS